MIVEIKVPEVGESITEGVLVEWLADDGAAVAKDDPLFELETDKITMTVAAEQAGVLSHGVEEESEVEVGQVVGTIDTEGAAAAGGGDSDGEGDGDGDGGGDQQVNLDDFDLSPAVRRVVAEHKLDPTAIEGTGKGGRITKEDALKAADSATKAPPQPTKTSAAEPKASAPEPRPAQKRAAAPPPQPTAPAGERRKTIKPMSTLRRRLAQRLVEVQQTAAILTTFNEVDMTAVMTLRQQYKQAFEDKHGVRLGFMSFFVKAAVEALKAVPMVNNIIDGDDIVEQHFYDIGVAVGTRAGLVVPVVRDADKLSFSGVERTIGDLARRAQDRKLTLDELTGGTFTISNGGVYGSLLSTPILNPPQSAILGMHGIKKRAVVVDDDRVEARPMMYLALSYDHRIVDGQEAVTFLRRIVECIESPERLMLEV